MTDQKVFSTRYNQAYLLCSKLLSQKLTANGQETDSINHNLLQSVLASLPVIDLIMQQDFDEKIYRPLLKTAIEETRKELFPDLAKKRFISIDKIEDAVETQAQEMVCNVEETDITHKDNKIILQGLPPKSKAYLEKIIKENPKNLQHLRFNEQRGLLQRVALMSQLFPDHKVPYVRAYWDNKKLSKQQITDIYKSVLAGIEKNFPVNFLKSQAALKTQVMVRFLFTEILDMPENQQLLSVDADTFYEYRLNNILRHYNYSVKRIMQNAYPDTFPHWQGSKTSDNFWDSRRNRISAIRWLVQTKLGINVQQSGKIRLNKKDFSRHGLSYLFNSYYNSTSKALLEAYPDLQPWQTGPLPAEYWNSVHIKEALFWMLNRLDWQVAELPLRYNGGELTRQTFSSFGLSGLYENKFNCNIYKLASYVWPGRFEEWEFGNMPTDFWNSAENRKNFSAWFIKKFNKDRLDNNRSFTSLDEAKEYRFYSSLYRYCNGDFNRLLKNYAVDLAEQNKSRLLLKKWHGLIRQEKLSTLQSVLTHGLFFNMARIHARQRIDSYQRMKMRLEKRV